MSLKTVVAAPYRQRGTSNLPISEFIVALSLERDWYSPDQAEQIAMRAIDEGLLDRVDDELHVAFDPETVAIPQNFTPDDDLIQPRSVFDRILETLTENGLEKHEAVAGINTVQADLGLTVEAAALVYAHRRGIPVSHATSKALDALVTK